MSTWLPRTIITLLVWAVGLGPTFAQAGHFLGRAFSADAVSLGSLTTHEPVAAVTDRAGDGPWQFDTPLPTDDAPSETDPEPTELEFSVDWPQSLDCVAHCRLSPRSSDLPKSMEFPPEIEPPTRG